MSYFDERIQPLSRMLVCEEIKYGAPRRSYCGVLQNVVRHSMRAVDSAALSQQGIGRRRLICANNC